MKRLTEISVEGFRVFKDVQTAPLDSDVVLVYGPNGSGKTSLLHAIELALTGGITDLEVYSDSYPGCLRHFATSNASRIGMKYVDDADQAKEESVFIQPDGRIQPAQGALSRIERVHFLDRCYLSQARLSRLLEIYQSVDKDKKESPLATFVRELLGLDLLEHLSVGLQVIGDKRRIRKDIKAYSALEEQAETLLMQEARLQEQLSDALGKLSGHNPSTPADGIPDSLLSPSDDRETVDSASDEELDAILQQLRVFKIAIDQSAAVFDSLAAIGSRQSAADMRAEIVERTAAIQKDLSQLLSEHLVECREFLQGVPSTLSEYSEAMLFGSEWDQCADDVKRKIENLRSNLSNCAARENQLAQARAQSDALDREWLEVSAQLQQNPAYAHKLGEVLTQVLDHLNGQQCPVCDRDFEETARGELRTHIEKKLRDLEKQHILVATALSVQNKRDEQRKVLGVLEPQEAVIVQLRQVSELALGTGLQLQSRFTELMTSRQTWISNHDRIQITMVELKKKKKADEQRSAEVARLKAIALTLSIPISDQAQPLEILQRLQGVVRNRLEAAQSKQHARLTAKKARETVAAVRASIVECRSKLSKCRMAQQRADRVIEAARTIAKKAAEQKIKVIKQVFDQTMNGLWKELFERLVLQESFYPRLSPPQITRNRVETRLSAGRNGNVAFSDLAAVLSSGNLNTAALSLFLSLNLIEKPRNGLLVLDDPVQNMDDVHVVNMASLLKSICRQAGRQLLVAVHERSLFNFLRLELGPSSDGESLITVEMDRSHSGESTSLHTEKVVWQPDRVTFPAAVTA